MDIIYYYYFLFYSKILKDDEPHLLTTMALSATEGFAFNTILDMFFSFFFCISIGKWVMVSNIIIFNVINYLYFHKSDRAKNIINQKPMFYGSHKVSILLSFTFFIVLASSLIWGSIITKYLLETHCK